jgi:hypothetical protein
LHEVRQKRSYLLFPGKPAAVRHLHDQALGESTGTRPEDASKETAVVGKLKLKDHPALNRFDLSTWPPVWVNARQPNKQLIGAGGVFERSMFHEKTPDRLFLQIEFEGARYLGCLMARDSSFCRQLHSFLRNHIGKTVRDIGDLDVSFML